MMNTKLDLIIETTALSVLALIILGYTLYALSLLANVLAI